MERHYYFATAEEFDAFIAGRPSATSVEGAVANANEAGIDLNAAGTVVIFQKTNELRKKVAAPQRIPKSFELVSTRKLGPRKAKENSEEAVTSEATEGATQEESSAPRKRRSAAH